MGRPYADSLMPYQGLDAYLFLSYAHEDSAEVFPIVEELLSQGYRVWYDEGIDPGSEWDDNIAAHVEACSYFVALLSNNYLESSNCKDELYYARELEKPCLIVYIEDVHLPRGMRMRVGRFQAMYKSRYKDEKEFFRKLFSASGIADCRECGATYRGLVRTYDVAKKAPAHVTEKESVCAGDLAREYGMTSGEMPMRLHRMGIDVPSTSSTHDDQVVTPVRRRQERELDDRGSVNGVAKSSASVHDLAEEYGMTSEEMLLRLRSMRITAKSSSSILTEKQMTLARRRLERDLGDREPVDNAAKSPMRVCDLAGEYGITNREMLVRLRAAGISVETSSSTLTRAQVVFIRRWLESRSITPRT